jgi:hypothetical protein
MSDLIFECMQEALASRAGPWDSACNSCHVGGLRPLTPSPFHFLFCFATQSRL